MKRFVFVPFEIFEESKTLPDFAKRLSELSKLPIRIGEKKEFPNIKNIDIICVPDTININYDKQVKSNFIQCIDYTNDFESMTKRYRCKVVSSNNEYYFSPCIPEKHCLKFKIRIQEHGTYSFAIIDESDNCISENYVFEVL